METTTLPDLLSYDDLAAKGLTRHRLDRLIESATAYDPESFTARRCADAVRAGVAAVLHDVTGIVVRIS